MKFITLLFCVSFFCFGLGANAQVNLVPNGSFEHYNQCPDNWDKLSRVKEWFSVNGQSPDYWNSCDTSNLASVPYNKAGFQYAASGNAYAGLVIYGVANAGYRENIEVKLISPLTKGLKYYVTYKVSPSYGLYNGANSGFKYISNNQCVLFANIAYSLSNPLKIQNFAHLINDSVIGDTSAWTTLRWSFIADSSYKYMVLGNLFDDNQTNKYSGNPAGQLPNSYYYIDDVCVSTDSSYCELTVNMGKEQPESEIKVYPNPCENVLNIDLGNDNIYSTSIYVYDIYGKLILSGLKGNQTPTIDTRTLPNGVYVLSIQSKDKRFNKIFIKNNSNH